MTSRSFFFSETLCIGVEGLTKETRQQLRVLFNGETKKSNLKLLFFTQMKMATWPIVLLSFLFVVKALGEAQSIKKEGQRALQPSNDVNVVENVVRSSMGELCMTWQCRRNLILRSMFQKAARAAEKKSSGIPGSEETPCITWQCKRKRRAVPERQEPEPLANDEPCLTRDCRTGKRSLAKRNSGDGSHLMEKLRFIGQSEERRTAPGCIAWHCNGKRR